MLRSFAFNLVLALGLISSSAVFAAIPTPPISLCYQNCINDGYSHNECVEHCNRLYPPTPRNPRTNDVRCDQTFIDQLSDTEVRAAELAEYCQQ